MKIQLTILLIFFQRHIYAETLSYKWIHLNKNRLDRGKCFEVDPTIQINNLKEEELTSYFKRVKTELCRPKELLILFII